MLQREHSAILSTFIKLSFVIKIFVLSIFEWLLKTGFTLCLEFLSVSEDTCMKVNKGCKQTIVNMHADRSFYRQHTKSMSESLIFLKY